MLGDHRDPPQPWTLVNMFDSVISNVVNIEKINDSDLWLLGVVFNGRVWYAANFKWQKLVKNIPFQCFALLVWVPFTLMYFFLYFTAYVYQSI